MNFILSMTGAAILVALGFVIGFWLEIATTPSLLIKFTKCEPGFVETHR